MVLVTLPLEQSGTALRNKKYASVVPNVRNRRVLASLRWGADAMNSFVYLEGEGQLSIYARPGTPTQRNKVMFDRVTRSAAD